MRIAFGDNVRVRLTSETEAAGVARSGGAGLWREHPSVSGVEVIGAPYDDFALNVYFEERHEGFWFAPELVELLDHGVGTEIRLDGIDKKWVRTVDGG
jgi:hypothetical protein